MTMPSTKPLKKSQGFTMALASAVFEWLLIVLLFADAIFSYLVTKFAHYCELQPPCFLCSRLDHVLRCGKVGFYQDLLCRYHKLEISSLVFCLAHSNLVDVHGMCETCLFSLAKINKSNSEMYRWLVGNIGKNPQIDLYEEPSPKHRKSVSSSKIHCLCCNELVISTGQELSQAMSVRFDSAEFDLPLPSAGDLNKRKYKPSGTVSSSKLKNNEFGILSHIGYTEVKITSDTESDAPHSDDDGGGSAQVCDFNSVKAYSNNPSERVEPSIISLNDDLVSKIPINPPPFKSEPSDLVSEAQWLGNVPNVGTPVATDIAACHVSEDFTWQWAETKTEASPQSKFICRSHMLHSMPPVSCSEPAPACASETGNILKTRNQPVAAREMALGMGPLKSKSLDLGDACKMDGGNRGRQLSGLLSKQWSVKDSSGVNEDVKLLLSQISACHGIELPGSDANPEVSVNGEELKSSDPSGSNGLQILQKRTSLERNESGVESLDGSIVSEIEGESFVDRLKRQVEHDKRTIVALYKELDEERNASAISASQAMAMITRLQEEKATLHLEGLQYLRMMEEQAEYDMEALQKTNELLAEKEKEVQDLEEEIDFFRKKFPNESVPENAENSAPALQWAEDNASSNSVSEKPISSSELEEEWLHILQCVKKLEEKSQLFSNNGECLHLPNGRMCLGIKGDEGSPLKRLSVCDNGDELKYIEEIVHRLQFLKSGAQNRRPSVA